MRILYLHQYFCPPDGWGNTRSLELSRHWVRAGHQVQVLTSPALFPISPPTDTLSVDGIEVKVLPVAYSHAMGYTDRIHAFLQFYQALLAEGKRLPRPDLIYASSTPLTVALAGQQLARHHACPWVFETVDVWPDVPIGMGILRIPLVNATLHAATNRLYRRASLVVSLSEGMAEQVAGHGVPRTKILVSHNGTDTRQFVPPAQPPPDAPVRLLYAGTIGPANGVHQLIQALQLLQDQHPRLHWHCDILGWGKELPRVQQLLTPELRPQVSFHPPVPKAQLLPWLQQAHIGLVTFAPYPVLQANSANKFFDYLAAGLPVAINYQGWQAQYLQNWEAGLSAPQRDVTAFADNLAQMVTNATLRQHMSANARRLAEAHFDRQRLAEALLSRFESLIQP